jgi:uncharacterized protein YbcI/CBS domain-containing protein
MICPACGSENLPGQDECAHCLASLQQEDVPQPDTPARWRVMVDPVSSLAPSLVEMQTVPAGTSLAEAVRRMQERNIGYLLVVHPDGTVAGILTEHDLLSRVAAQVEDLSAHTVDAFMRRDPAMVEPSEPINHALFHMATDDFLYVPIVDEANRPQDVLSFRRIVHLIEHMEKTAFPRCIIEEASEAAWPRPSLLYVSVTPDQCSMMPHTKTKGQIEAEISDAMVKLQREHTGRGPNQTRTFILEDMVLVRMQEVLTPVERQLTGNPHGQSLVKQFHQQMHEIARKELESIIESHTGCRVTSIHSDVSTKTGEQMAIFVLDRNLEHLLPRRHDAPPRR